MESKKDIRKRLLEKRNCITDIEWEEKSRRIYKNVVTHPFFLEADAIYCYVDYRGEVGTLAIIEKAWEMQKKVAVPKVEGNEMQFYYIQQFSDLQEGYRGILEPKSDFPADDKNVLVILPGAAFDRKRNRIGYGKGFYDRFLNTHRNYHTIAIGFEFQMVNEIPAEPQDLCPQVLITEEHIYDEHVTK